MTGVLLLVSLLAQSRGPAVSPVPDDLDAVKALYASASFEDALTRLSQVNDAHDPEVEEYRALCLLGLGRTVDAQRSLERLVTEDPSFAVASADVSPRFLSMFHDVRRRVLPAAAKALYATARQSFDDKRYLVASDQFKALVALLKDDDMTESAELKDLRTLGEGFDTLIDARLADEAKAAPAFKPAPATDTASATAAPAAGIEYKTGDEGVTAPKEISRPMPPWHLSGGLGRQTEYHGMLEILVNERGLVAQASLKRSIFPQYDTALLQATKDWKFQPAMKDGQPVAYRETIAITLSPR
jgi:TonB family protein